MKINCIYYNWTCIYLPSLFSEPALLHPKEIMLSPGVLGKKALSSEAQEWAYDLDLTDLSILHWSS